MKLRFLKYTLPLFTFIIIAANICLGQKPATAPIFTVDSLASGNFKDILTSFFQLGFNNLTGLNKELNFNSNPFAVMLKSNPALAIDKYYFKYRTLRKLNFGFSIKLDTSYRFNGFSSGIKYALINERDSTTSLALFDNLKKDSLNVDIKKLETELQVYADEKFPVRDSSSNIIRSNITAKKMFIENMTKLRSFNPYIPFDKLDTTFQNAAISIAKQFTLQTFLALVEKDPGASIQKTLDQTFIDLKTAIKNKLLWTVGVSDTTYKDQFLLSNLVISSELSKGIFKPAPGSNLELDIKAACNFLKDTLLAGRNLKRIIFNFEPGVNWVIRTKNNDKSIFEFKLSGSYTHNFTQLYASEKRDAITMNSTIRIRIYEDIWVPVEIKYDPANGNVFGLFNVRANFTGLGKLLKGI
jgi:hypothetical protein